MSTETESFSITMSKEDQEIVDRRKLRKELELMLVNKYNSAFSKKLATRQEFWFLMDSKWLNKWNNFVLGDDSAEEPGPVSTFGLLDAKLNPLPNLEVVIDYRGVIPLVYYILKELYGKDKSPELCRYVLDIYAMPVETTFILRYQNKPQRHARIAVNNIRKRWMKWNKCYIDNDDDNIYEQQGICGLSKEHLEAFLFWLFTCCERKKRGRHRVSYRKYNPLRKSKGRGDDDDESDILLEDLSEVNEDGSSNLIRREGDEYYTENGNKIEVRDYSNPEKEYALSRNGSGGWINMIRHFFG